MENNSYKNKRLVMKDIKKVKVKIKHIPDEFIQNLMETLVFDYKKIVKNYDDEKELQFIIDGIPNVITFIRNLT